MSGYTPLVRVTGISSPATCDSKGLGGPSRRVLAALEPQLRATLAGLGSARQERKTKKIEPLRRELQILTGSGARPIRPPHCGFARLHPVARGDASRPAQCGALAAKERRRGKRHQEAAQEDAQAQEEEAAQALAPQAEVDAARASSGRYAADCGSAAGSSSTGPHTRTKRPSSRFTGCRRGRNESTGRRRRPSPRSSFCIARLPGSIISPRRR